MPVEKDLKVAYNTLYEDEEPAKALELYDKVLGETPENLTALVYKAHALEKLYFSDRKWRNVGTLDEAKSCLALAEDVALQRGDRKKMGWVYFRWFVLQFNLKYYKVAETYLSRAKRYGYEDPMLQLWEDRLAKKLEKLGSKLGDAQQEKEAQGPDPEQQDKGEKTQQVVEEAAEGASKDASKLRTDWYQSSDKVTISFFTTNLPESKDVMKVSVPDNQTLSIEYPVKTTGSEFQYSIKLAQKVDTDVVSVNVLTKKFEITLKKQVTKKWNSLEFDPETAPLNALSSENSDHPTKPIAYPSSSKKHIDWSKIDLDDGEVENGGSADAFFQQLYADADPDTRRAMMKSFIESNGTTLNTNWEEVGSKKVETALPEGQELREW